MKLRLVLKSKTKNNKDVSLKLNIAPSKHIGFINFVNLALNQDQPITLSFEKLSKTGETEESKIAGQFKFAGKDDPGLKKLEEEVIDDAHRKEKQHQKRIH
ncbi:MAG TPA: hypothetical protein VGB37_06800 [Candidatus Lokiarchaeia archaeon]